MAHACVCCLPVDCSAICPTPRCLVSCWTHSARSTASWRGTKRLHAPTTTSRSQCEDWCRGYCRTKASWHCVQGSHTRVYMYLHCCALRECGRVTFRACPPTLFSLPTPPLHCIADAFEAQRVLLQTKSSTPGVALTEKKEEPASGAGGGCCG